MVLRILLRWEHLNQLRALPDQRFDGVTVDHLRHL
jgi:hypothetical protein